MAVSTCSHGDPEVQAFMRQIMDALEVKNAGQLANLLAREHMIAATDVRKVYRWVSGQSAPNFYFTVRLAERAGLLRRNDPPGS